MSIITTDNEEAAYIFNEIIANEERNNAFGCTICKKTFKTYRGLNQHIRSCLTKTNNNSTISTSQSVSINRNNDAVRKVNNDAIREINNQHNDQANLFQGNERP